jgi:RimJ/RimL family protein N-acetyltransferase
VDLEAGLPVGPRVDERPAPSPSRVRLAGQYVDVVPLDPRAHGDALFEDAGGREHDALWVYLYNGPFPDRPGFDAWLASRAASHDPLVYAVVDKRSARAVGTAALMRMDQRNRAIEVGHILYTPRLQQTRGGTEAMFLLARYVFEELGYRRYEWKCNALNARSRAAAARLGFTFEGVFRQHTIAKGRNRDTAWYSMLDHEWPARRSRFERWLAAGNFDADGRQREALRRSV